MNELEDVNIEGIYDTGRAIKASDKLNYKHVIQFHILTCQRYLGDMKYGDKVEALKDCIYFDIGGLPFKTKIDEAVSKFEFERRVEIRLRERTNPNEMKNPVRRISVITTINERYYKKLNRFLVQLVAEYQGLLGMKGLVEEGLDEHTEEKKYKKLEQYKKYKKEEMEDE